MHVIATAGHVDHGKSTLIRGLTGMEPDRWVEERRRGLTIDLGYARMTLPDGTQIAFVDVPGHHRFVTNMLAGVGPVPAVQFVVAAEQGWSAQSTEHLEALKALDVRHGVLAISRCDLGDAELAESGSTRLSRRVAARRPRGGAGQPGRRYRHGRLGRRARPDDETHAGPGAAAASAVDRPRIHYPRRRHRRHRHA
jgi:selenocysteine-specific elongation factor